MDIDAELDAKIDDLQKERTRLHAELLALISQLYEHSVRYKDSELTEWLKDMEKKDTASMESVSSAFRDLTDEVTTSVEDSFEDRLRHLDHLRAVKRKVQEQLQLRVDFLLDAIERPKTKLREKNIAT